MKYVSILLCSLVLTAIPLIGLAYEINDQILVADFNSGEKPNNLGGDFGTWEYDPADETQKCEMQFVDNDVFANADGKAIQLTYDVQSPRPAFNGFWIKLQGIDLTPFNKLRFYVKGDEGANFTSRFKVELKNALGKRAIYLVNGITSQWGEVIIDFKQTKAITDWSNMTELTIVFSDLVATFKEGAVYIDDISFLNVSE